MENNSEKLGITTIDPGVLTNIAKLASLSIPGVSRTTSGPHSLDALVSKKYSDGVKIEVENDTVYVDIYLVMKSDADLRKTSRLIQQKVSRSITEMVGMPVGHVNIHIEDIDYLTA
jgi:uncharacterized alkaline shock family protein YloU